MDPISTMGTAKVVACYSTVHSLPVLTVLFLLIGLPLTLVSNNMISALNDFFYPQVDHIGIQLPLIEFHRHIQEHLNIYLQYDRVLSSIFSIIDNLRSITESFSDRTISVSRLHQGYNHLNILLPVLDNLIFNLNTLLDNLQELINNHPEYENTISQEFIRVFRLADARLSEYTSVFRSLIADYRQAEAGLLIRNIISEMHPLFLNE